MKRVMELLIISRRDGWAWYIFSGKPGSLIARSTASKATIESVRNTVYRKNPDFKRIPERVFHSTDKLPKWFLEWEEESQKDSGGVLYALKHPSFEGLIKLGFTDKPLEDTIRRQSNLLPIPEPFELIDKWQVSEGQQLIRILRKKLKDQYGTEKRSFFRIKRSKLKAAVEATLEELSVSQ